MRHKNRKNFQGRKKGNNKLLAQGLIKELIIKEKLNILLSHAKQIRPRVEKLISIGKEDSLAKLRLLISRTGSKRVADKIQKDIAKRYEKRPGGYTRILKCGYRKGDNANMSLIELV